MSGKLITKRKREENMLAGPSSSFDVGLQQAPRTKREKIDCEEGNSTETQNDSPTTSCATSKLLIEALQKIVELQSELDDFENDLDGHENIPEYADDSHNSFYSDDFPTVQQVLDPEEAEALDELYERHEAEALGYAMCAREALLFLEREGISTSSAIYQALRERLVDRADGIPI